MGACNSKAKAAAAGICQDHARFASACMLNELLCEVPAWLVAEEWGVPQKLTATGAKFVGYVNNALIMYHHDLIHK